MTTETIAATAQTPWIEELDSENERLQRLIEAQRWRTTGKYSSLHQSEYLLH